MQPVTIYHSRYSPGPAEDESAPAGSDEPGHPRPGQLLLIDPSASTAFTEWTAVRVLALPDRPAPAGKCYLEVSVLDITGRTEVDRRTVLVQLDGLIPASATGPRSSHRQAANRRDWWFPTRQRPTPGGTRPC